MDTDDLHHNNMQSWLIPDTDGLHRLYRGAAPEIPTNRTNYTDDSHQKCRRVTPVKICKLLELLRILRSTVRTLLNVQQPPAVVSYRY